MKYKLDTNDQIIRHGTTLSRVVRLSDGVRGGYIEHEGNLSQNGDCFIHDDSIALADTFIADDAQLWGTALGRARLTGSAKVRGILSDDAQVGGEADVHGKVEDFGIVRGQAHVRGRVFGHAIVEDKAQVFGEVGGNVHIHGSEIVVGQRM